MLSFHWKSVLSRCRSIPGGLKDAMEGWFDSFRLNFKKNIYIQGVPKKTLFLGFLAITPLWKGLEIKVGGVSKNSGNSLCDRHKNFPNWPFRSWENWVHRWQPYLQNLDKNGGNFFWIEMIFLYTLYLRGDRCLWWFDKMQC